MVAGDLRRELRSRPMRVAIPNTPRDRGIRTREFLEDLQRISRHEVKAAVWGRKEDAKEAEPCQVAREIVR